MNGILKVPPPVNEPVLSYAPGAAERVELKRALKDLSARQIEIPLIVGGEEVRTGTTVEAVMPHCYRHVLARVHQAAPRSEVELPADLQALIESPVFARADGYLSKRLVDIGDRCSASRRPPIRRRSMPRAS